KAGSSMAELLADPVAVRQLIAELEKDKSEDKLGSYKPYPKQLEFHNADYRERLLIAGNRSGKTLAGGMEATYHATGRYPNWWKGRRFEGPTVGWEASKTNEVLRDAAQVMLLGELGARGTGCIPKADIVETVSARGTPNLCDSILVRHVSGGVSTIG